MILEKKLSEILSALNGHNNGDSSTGITKKWLEEQFTKRDDAESKINFEDFAVYFLNSVRQHTEIHLRCNENTETPISQTSVSALKIAKTNYTINVEATPKRILFGGIQQSKTSTPDAQKAHTSNAHSLDDSSHRWNGSFNVSILNTPTPSKQATSPLECAEPFHNSSKSNTSTPVRRSSSRNYSHNRRANTNSLNNTTPSTSAEKSSRNITASSSMCLGDFLVLNAPNNKFHKKKQNSSNLQQNQNEKDATTTQTSSRPKKRVVPTTITDGRVSNSSAFGNNSAFSKEDNILILSQKEIDDKNKCAILEARKSLKKNSFKITKEVEDSVVENKLFDAFTKAAEIITPFECIELLSPIDLKTVMKPDDIRKIALIYSTLMDLNFTTNVLNEISFLLNILNANESEKLTQMKEIGNALKDGIQNLQIKEEEAATGTINNEESPIALLENVTNCVYFALSVLDLQKNTLAMLDLRSLGVVLHSERILTLSPNLKEFLEKAYRQKENEIQYHKRQDIGLFIRLDNSSFNNVAYQEDKDSRQNFSSNNEFGAFKSQRDLFYKILKCWESNHLNPSWNFQQEITPHIRELFKLSEHPVNMAHFANLFVSQLLISSNYVSSPEEIGVDIDLQKFSKLTQRLLAPSKFSVDYQFPHNQAFFRDFIYESRSIAFLEQLKLTIYTKLMSLNNSTYEMVNILKSGNDEVEDIIMSASEFIVRPEILSSMQVLAKFLGYVTVLPYNYNSSLSAPNSTSLDKKQLVLRSSFQPNFNLSELLQDAIKSGKILITVPWLVQYLAMLDNVTLQLESYVNAIELLFCIYMHIASLQQEILNDDWPTSFTRALFIIRCCLGWLFDTKPIIAEQYYTHRVIFEKNEYSRLLALTWNRPCNHEVIKVHPMIESVLNIACPFLAEFRVSIMPAKYSMVKYVSRTGRYRHITTRTSELSATSALNLDQRYTPERKLREIVDSDANESENKLIEAFLHSQNSTMRRLIEFIMERVYKSTVKDAQFQILIPSKSSADQKINEITSKAYTDVYRHVQKIYDEARLSAITEWDKLVPNIIEERIKKALDALLQRDIQPKIKQLYFELIKRNTTSKVLEWRHANMFKTNFYCPNFEEMVPKICKANSKTQQTINSSELRILNSTPSVSAALDELQYWMHCTSMRPELVINNTAILKVLQTLPQTFKNVLPTALYRVVSLSIIQLVQNIVARYPLLITTELLDAFNLFWLSKEMQHQAVVLHHQYQIDAKKKDDDESEAATADDLHSDSVIIPCIFDNLITISFIESLGARSICYIKLHSLLISMIKVNVINIEFVNKLFLKIFKFDWHPSVLNEISNMLTKIAKESQDIYNGTFSPDEDVKSNLFMEVLADFSRDVDEF